MSSALLSVISSVGSAVAPEAAGAVSAVKSGDTSSIMSSLLGGASEPQQDTRQGQVTQEYIPVTQPTRDSQSKYLTQGNYYGYSNRTT